MTLPHAHPMARDKVISLYVSIDLKTRSVSLQNMESPNMTWCKIVLWQAR